jgi:hypothetical protein
MSKQGTRKLGIRKGNPKRFLIPSQSPPGKERRYEYPFASRHRTA